MWYFIGIPALRVKESFSVAHSLQIFTEFENGVEGSGGRDIGAVVADEDSLRGLDSDETFLAL